jgi:branched-chain amino acid transport system substrate-binding protein
MVRVYRLSSPNRCHAFVRPILSRLASEIVPVALKSAKPGTPEFHEALRKALLSEKDIAASQGVYNFTEKDRYGVDERARVLLTVKAGNFEVIK